MSPTRYSYDVDLGNLNTSHTQAILSVAPGSRVLDIGAADGSVAKRLVERGCQVWGVEIDEAAARSAAAVCERVVVADVEHLDVEAEFQGRAFDYVLCLDVLEHLREPLLTLQRLRSLLGTRGQLVASIPNVAHGAVRLNLLRGEFSYTEMGLLDRTHLRFFNRSAVASLFEGAGFEIRDWLRVVRGITETEIAIDLQSFSPNLVAEMSADIDATTFQFVVIAGVRQTSRLLQPSESLASRLQQRVALLEGQVSAAHARIAILDGETAATSDKLASLELQHQEDASRIADLSSELTRRMEELHRSDRDLRHLANSVAVKEAFASELLAELSTARQAEASVKSYEEFVSSTGVQVLLSVSRRLRRAPRLRGWLHRMLRAVGRFGPTMGQRPASDWVQSDRYQRDLGRVAEHWTAEAGTWAVGRGVHWLENPCVQERINMKVCGCRGLDRYEHFINEYLGDRTPVERALTLGCGAGELERGLCQYSFSREHEGLDIAPGAIAMAVEAAHDGKHRHLRYRVDDMNRLELRPEHYDVIFAISSLHHVASLEHVMSEVARALKPGGWFFIDEYVGPNRFQWTDAQLDAVNAALEQMPLRLKRSVTTPSLTKGPVRRPSAAAIAEVDPSEAIRSTEIERLLPRYFVVVDRKGQGGSLLNPLLEDIAGNFGEHHPGSIEYLKSLFDLEDRLIAEGVLQDDFATIIARKPAPSERAFQH